MLLFENTGSRTNADFRTVWPNDLGLDSVPVGPIGLGDLDADGDLDVLVAGISSGNSSEYQYRPNAGTRDKPSFGPPGSLELGFAEAGDAGSWQRYSSLQLVDLDLDGDLDVLQLVLQDGSGNKAFMLHDNLGEATAPKFGAPIERPFGLQESGLAHFATGDLDGDGDSDVLASAGGLFVWYENTGR